MRFLNHHAWALHRPCQCAYLVGVRPASELGKVREKSTFFALPVFSAVDYSVCNVLSFRDAFSLFDFSFSVACTVGYFHQCFSMIWSEEGADKERTKENNAGSTSLKKEIQREAQPDADSVNPQLGPLKSSNQPERRIDWIESSLMSGFFLIKCSLLFLRQR